MPGLDWARARQRALIMKRKRQSRPMTLGEVPIGTTGFRGVYFEPERNRYRAAIEIGGKRIRLGRFRTAMAAGAAYDAAARAAWGSAAVTNPTKDLEMDTPDEVITAEEQEHHG